MDSVEFNFVIIGSRQGGLSKYGVRTEKAGIQGMKPASIVYSHEEGYH